MKHHDHQIAYLRPEQIVAQIRHNPIAYLPLGPLEWHGPHLPFGTDPLNAETTALRVAEITGGLVFPTLYWGTERERSPEALEQIGFERSDWIIGMDFPSNSVQSLYAREEVFAILIREQIRLISNMGFQLIVIISGHGAANHLAALQRLAAEHHHLGGCKILVVMPFLADAQGQLHVGHADRTETALMLAHYPETVSPETLPALPQPLRNVDWGVVDSDTFEGNPTPERTVREMHDPRRASPAEGAAIAAQVVDQIVHLVNTCRPV
ncbi:MAG: creatininase family protein [Anaerolineae bacterium]|nr:creatininase family protein [Anaerolineae bacterium]